MCSFLDYEVVPTVEYLAKHDEYYWTSAMILPMPDQTRRSMSEPYFEQYVTRKLYLAHMIQLAEQGNKTLLYTA